MTDDSAPPRVGEGLLRAALDAVDSAVFAVDDGGRILEYNAAAVVATGRDAADLSGTHVAELVADPDGRPLRAALSAAAEDGEATVEATLVDADGRRQPYAFRAVRAVDGEPVLAVLGRPAADRERSAALERTTEAVLAVDEEWRLTYANDRAREVLRAAMDDAGGDELAGRNIWEAVSAAVDTPFYDRYHEAMATQEPVTFTEYYPPLDTHFEVRAYPSETGLSVYFRDVTDRVERERDLEMYEAIVDTAADMIYALNAEGRFVAANDALLEATGYDREEVIGSHASLLTDEDTTDQVDRLQADLDEGEVGVVETELRTRDGDTIPVENRFAPFPPDAEDPRGRVGVARDISERLRREKQLRRRDAALRQVYEVTTERTAPFERKVERLLSIGCDVLGVRYGVLSRVEGEDYVVEVARSPDDAFQAGDVLPLSATYCERVVADGGGLSFGDVDEEAPDLTDRDGYGEMGITCYLGAPVVVTGAGDVTDGDRAAGGDGAADGDAGADGVGATGDDGAAGDDGATGDDGVGDPATEVYGTFCFYDDRPRESFSEWEVTFVDLMSQWVGHELSGIRARRRLRAQNERLERFTSIVSHDLRNSLEMVKGYVDVAEETGDPEHFAEARRGAERMERLVEDLLALTRAGEDIDDREPVALAELAEECWATVDAGSARLVVETDATVSADRSRLRQLLANLFRNGLEHGVPDGGRGVPGGGDGAREGGDAAGADGPAVTVTVGETPDGEGFYVADDGSGIPVEDRDRVFDTGYTTAEDGTGIGLDIVRTVAEAHGWTVGVSASADGGARFEFRDVRFVAPGD